MTSASEVKAGNATHIYRSPRLASLRRRQSGCDDRWEHGFSYPDEELIDDIAHYFHIAPSELIGA